MGFYENRILPSVIDCACSMAPIMEMRNKVVPLAKGTVLEVGMGSAINLSLYRGEQVDRIFGLEPSPGMRVKAQKNLARSAIQVDWLDLPGEQIPLEDNSVDTVLLTYTLCTIPDWLMALKQMRRVLKAEGKLLFCEHGRSPEVAVARWQDRLTPLWKKLAGGCHINRPIDAYIKEAGFQIEHMETLYMEKAPRIAGYMYYGTANPGKEN
jgi:ubiquinone/menaquinone biosynthesis C-methylase UbiE